MVSGTRCPAWSDQLKKWSESRAAAPKGRCPVGHRGEFPCYSMGICSFFVNFLLSNENFGIFFCFVSIFYGIQQGFLHFSVFCQFSMLLNGNFSMFPFFVNFPCYSMRILAFFQFLIILHVIQWEYLYFFSFCQYSMLFNRDCGFWPGGGTDVRTEGRTEGRTEFVPCVLQDIGPLGPLPKKRKRDRDTDRQGERGE